MKAQEALTSRRTIHRFRAEPVPEEVLLRALSAANHAPAHKLTWPWRFTLPGPRARDALLQINLGLRADSKPLTPEQAQALRRKMCDPAHLVVVTQVLAEDAYRRREDYAACCCAVQNMMLSLHASGVGSKWSTGAVTRAPASLVALGIDHTVQGCVGFVWVGMAEVVPRSPERPPLAELIRRVP